MKEISHRRVVRPIIVVNGQVAGLWIRTIKRDTLLLELDYFSPADNVIKLKSEGSAQRLGGYWDKKVNLH